MLVLARKPGQAITLSNGTRIVVLKSTGKCIRLGIEAPQEMTVLREELLNKRRPQCEATSRLNAHQTDAEK
jgi:carbon storage regulator